MFEPKDRVKINPRYMAVRAGDVRGWTGVVISKIPKIQYEGRDGSIQETSLRYRVLWPNGQVWNEPAEMLMHSI